MSKNLDQYGRKPPEDRSESEGRQLRLRSGLLIVLFLGILLAYGYVLYDTQIVHGDDYLTTASYTTEQRETVDSVRGEILDSYGRVLVSNTYGYEVTLDTSVMGTNKNEILSELLILCREEGVEWSDSLPITDSAPYSFTRSDVYTYLLTRTETDDDGNEVETTEERRTNLGLLAVKYGWISDPLAEEQDEDAVTYLSAQDLMVKMCAAFGIELPEAEEGESPEISSEVRDLLGVLYELALRSREVVYSEYVFAEDVDITFISKAKERGLTGVNIESVPSRQYDTTYAAHVLGRTGAIPNEQWEAYKEQGYSYDATVGLSGVELAFEDYLKGTSGVRAIVTSDSGKIVSEEWVTDEETGETLEPVPGANVSLTIDIAFQAAVEQALNRYMESLETEGGAAVAVVDMTGGVQALASYPTYDLATYGQNYNDLRSDEREPLFNRATNGLYAPGSTFKMITAIAGLMEGEITTRSTITCQGSQVFFSSDRRNCWRRSGHGRETVTDAITDSCNIFFYNVGYQVGIEKLGEYAAMFGLGQSTGIEIGDTAGYIAGPDTSETLGQTWYGGNVLSAAIGQDNNLFSPLQLANYVATLVNGGDLYKVHLLNSVKSSDYSEVLLQYEPELVSSIDIPDEYLEAIKQGMYGVTQSSSLAGYFNALPVKAGAKTGTAQINNNTSTNALFVAFAPYDDPQIALCIVVEEGASGSSLGGLAAEILGYYFATDESIDPVTDENVMIR